MKTERILVNRCTRNMGLEVTRALGMAGYSVLGVDDRTAPLGLRSRFMEKTLEISPGFMAHHGDEFLALVEAERPDVILPLGSSDIVCERQAEFRRYSHVLTPDPGAYALVNDKQRLVELCSELDIPVPKTFSLDSARKKLATHEGTGPLSLVVKPRGQIGRGDGVSFVSSPEALEAAYESVRARIGAPLVTEFVPGPSDNMLSLQLLFDADTRLIGYFIMKKSCLWPPSVGVTAAAISTHQVSLVESVLPLFENLEWRGPAEVEFKIDAVSNQPMLLEINPRFSGAVSFPLRCGLNLAAMFCRAAMGEVLPAGTQPQYVEGIRYVSPAIYLRGSLERARRRGLGYALKRARHEVLGERVPTVYQLSDLAPTIGKALLQLREPDMEEV